jgi:hypothetical protein
MEKRKALGISIEALERMAALDVLPRPITLSWLVTQSNSELKRFEALLRNTYDVDRWLAIYMELMRRKVVSSEAISGKVWITDDGG